MRNNLFKIAQAAIFGIALAFTFSCSSGGDDSTDDGGSGTSNLSNLPKQVYLDGSEYKGSNDIILLMDPYDNPNDIMQAGKIQNGQVLLNLPEKIDGKYLRNLENECFPKNTALFKAEGFLVTIPDKGNCFLELDLVGKAQGGGGGIFHYFSKSGKINGTCRKYIDWNFSEGWNVTYVYYDSDDKYAEEYVTSDLSKTGGKLEWHIDCSYRF